MTDQLVELGGKHALICAAQGPLLGDEADATDFLRLAYASNAELLAVPVSRIDKRFFDLRSGLAGQIVQKFANYHIQLVVVGDVAEWTRNSRSFRDFVYEANNGNVLWFVTDEEALRAKLTGTLPGGLAAAFTSSRR